MPDEIITRIAAQREEVIRDILAQLNGLTGLRRAIRQGKLDHAIAVVQQLGKELWLLKRAERAIRAEAKAAVREPNEGLGAFPARNMAIFQLVLVDDESPTTVGRCFGISGGRAQQVARNVARYSFNLSAWRLDEMRAELKAQGQLDAVKPLLAEWDNQIIKDEIEGAFRG